MQEKKSRASWAALLLLVPVLLLIFAFALPKQYKKTYLAALSDKAALLKSTDQPKIVLIGGSGVAFNLSAELLEQEFPEYRVVNFGLYAGLGTTVMLELALPDLHNGDIVVFSPELSVQTLSDWLDAEMMWQASEDNPGLLLRLTSRAEKLLAAFPRYAAQKARFTLFGNAPDSSGIYARSSFTDHGDVRMDLRPYNVMPGGWDVNMPLQFDQLPTDDFIDVLNRFVDQCAAKRVSVYYYNCPMNASAIQEDDLNQSGEYIKHLKSVLHCEILGQIENAILDEDWFFDTNFHLNGAGTVLHTVQLANDLKKALNDQTPVSLEAPSMPVPYIPTTASEGNIADHDCFIYAFDADFCRIISLSDSGKLRKDLTLPASHAGKPILSFEPDTFSHNEQITTITIQENIRVIPDDSFAGCTNLQTIFLLQPDPSSCSVGQALLSGTNASIAVPSQSYGRYCANYFWAPYAHRLIPIDDISPFEDAASVEPKTTDSPTKPKPVTAIEYNGNGGVLRGGSGNTLTRSISLSHIRENTLPGTVWFERPGFVMIAWNTEPDGSGFSVGLGSRFDPLLGSKLYAQWVPCTQDTEFEWSIEGTSAYITGYHGQGGSCVLPELYKDLPVRGIKAEAFKGVTLEILVLSPALRTVDPGAFTDCSIETIILFDSLQVISDESFRQCSGASVLKVQASTSPVYSGSYFDTFQDKYDRLLSLRGKRKIVLASGSSGRYGYDSEAIKQAFPAYEPANMGVYAYTNAYPQLLLMLPLLEENDILLYAPEFDAIPEQFCVSDALDSSFWAMMESNYDAAATLDMRSFSRVFDSFQDYLQIRSRMPKKSYEISPAQFDDDGNAYLFSTYNQYGDFILPRPNGNTDDRLRHNIADYTIESFPEGTVESLNRVLQLFQDQGALVLFSYTPRNSASLTEESTPEARRILHLYLKESLSVPLISEIEDYLLPGRYFWLIDSHTSTEGAAKRTKLIINDLQDYLERSKQY